MIGGVSVIADHLDGQYEDRQIVDDPTIPRGGRKTPVIAGEG